MYFSVHTMQKIWYEIGMEVWKIVFHFILEIFHSIPFWHLPYSIQKFPFHSILFSIPFHTIPCPGCRFYIITIIVAFYHNGCSLVENPEAPDFEKIASASGSFSTLSLPSSLSLQPLSSKCFRFRFHKKLSASTASAFNFRFCFHIPGLQRNYKGGPKKCYHFLYSNHFQNY